MKVRHQDRKLLVLLLQAHQQNQRQREEAGLALGQTGDALKVLAHRDAGAVGRVEGGSCLD